MLKVIQLTGVLLVTLGLGTMLGNVVSTVRERHEGPLVKVVPTNNIITGSGNTFITTDLNPTKKLVHLKLNSNRTIQLLDEVNGDTAQRVVTELGRLNKQSSTEPITLIINSPGGSVLDGALIVDAMESSKAPVNTLCVQMCASMAALIHQYGQNRMVLSHSILMFHPAFGAAMDDVDRMVSQLEMIQRYAGKMEANVAKRSHLSFEEYKRRAAAQIWIDGEDAVNQHFADELVYLSNDDVQKLFGDASAQDRTKKTDKRTISALKNYVVYILEATVGYIRNTETQDNGTSIETNFNDIPSNIVAPDTHGIEPFYKNTKVSF